MGRVDEPVQYATVSSCQANTVVAPCNAAHTIAHAIAQLCRSFATLSLRGMPMLWLVVLKFTWLCFVCVMLLQAAYPEVQEEVYQELVAAGIAPAGERGARAVHSWTSTGVFMLGLLCCSSLSLRCMPEEVVGHSSSASA